MAKRYWTKKDAVRSFVETLEEVGADFPRGDSIGWRMAWNEHFDRLCRDGVIRPSDCSRGWTAPRGIPRHLIMTRTRGSR